jgi:hypothetical protein
VGTTVLVCSIKHAPACAPVAAAAGGGGGQADFSYYFDTGSRRRCYIAPERFHDAHMAAINAYAPLTPAMVRVGCCVL